MSRLARLAAVVLLVWVALLVGHARAVRAQPIDPKAVPPELRPWVPWVLDGHDEATCPALPDAVGGLGNLRPAGTPPQERPRCAWPARADLVLDEKGGRFTQRWHLEAAQWVPLPGDAKRWPLDVKAGAAGASVVLHGGAPSVRLERGDHVVTGAFAWDGLPESLRVPPETGLLSLTLRGVAVPSPNRDAEGVVWLQKTAKNEEGDALEFVVHRKVTDDIPLLLTTRIELHASGKNREALLGRALPAGFVPLSLDAPIPARLEPDGHVRVQLRPGVFTLELVARGEGPMSKLSRPKPEGPWREGDEVWVFDARADLRVVTVEGVPSIDPSQTTLPDAWKRLPAYPMKLGDTLTLEERRRGDADPPQNQLSLTRNLWLDFDGKGFTVSDSLQGTLSRDSRLTMADPTTLGRVAINGKDQFITKLDGLGAGVEIRQGQLSVAADSRIVGSPVDVPAVSWAHDFHKVHATLNLPPGYRLLHAAGVDDVPGTWVRHWSLLELFLALVLAVAVGRLYGPRWGVISLILFGLSFPEGGAPKWSWVPVLACEALFRALPVGKAKTVFAWARGLALVGVALITVPFLVQHVREGARPALAVPTHAGETSVASLLVDGESEARNDATLMEQKAAEDGPRAGAGAAGVAQAAAPEAPTADLEPQDGTKLARKTAASSATQAWRSSKERPTLQSNAMTYDPAAIVQTGPGLPRWRWTSLELSWSGPVAATQRLHLYLASPGENFALALLRALLLVVVFLRLFPSTQRFFPKGWGPTAAAAATVVVALLSVSGARAAEPPATPVLDELRAKLLRKPECAPSCTTSGRMLLEVRGDSLRARLEVDSAASAPFALPGSIGQFVPREVLVDGQPAKALLRGDGGQLYTLLAPGRHQVVVEGPMPERESLQLALPQKPHHVAAVAEGWTVEGIHEDGLADDNLQFTRKRVAGDGGASLQPGTLPPFVRVERTLRVGLNWQVDTRVVRVSPAGSAVVLEVPLLAGENVTTADVRVVGGKALVNMGPRVTEVSWNSVLEQRSPVKLTAPKSTAWIEVWRLDVGPIWHATYGGIPFVHTQPVAGVHFPEWRPWPGEEASVTLGRPDGVPGQTLTVDESTLDVRPGIRSTDMTLTLQLRSSRGAQHTVTLPEGAVLESLIINGVTQPVRQDSRAVTFPVVPGAQTVAIAFREDRGIAPFFSVSGLDAGAPTVNANVVVHVPGGRWLLFVGGPRLGPAVLFWSLLAVLLVVAALLGRNTKTPLKTGHWLLLAIGLSQVHIVLGGVFVAWLLALGYREKSDSAKLSPATFNLRQIGLALLTFAAIGVLFASIYKGLLGDPEMQVRGNGSSLSELRWFQDRTDAALPVPWLVSLPILGYRGLMLGWALWTALAVIRWLKWGWGAFTAGGGWKKSPPRPKPAPQPQGPARQAQGYWGPQGWVPTQPPAAEVPPEATASGELPGAGAAATESPADAAPDAPQAVGDGVDSTDEPKGGGA
ncbi:MAG TPA: hypothetical protein PLR99_17920 [Polyangiaceae bacterium]|nr:hypothetical protein [Polyangiaceae bacterium]